MANVSKEFRTNAWPSARTRTERNLRYNASKVEKKIERRLAQAACAAFLRCFLRWWDEGAESHSAHPPCGVAENTKLLEVQPRLGARLPERPDGLVPDIRARTRSLGNLKHLDVVVGARSWNSGRGRGTMLHTFRAREAVHA